MEVRYIFINREAETTLYFMCRKEVGFLFSLIIVTKYFCTNINKCQLGSQAEKESMNHHQILKFLEMQFKLTAWVFTSGRAGTLSSSGKSVVRWLASALL